MDIPQDILNTFMVREDYLEWIKDETVVFAYLDLTNILHWQDTLGWRFRVEDVVAQLLFKKRKSRFRRDRVISRITPTRPLYTIQA